MANIKDVHLKMREAIKYMKFVDTDSFRDLIADEKFDEAIALIDSTIEQNIEPVVEEKPKRKYTKKA